MVWHPGITAACTTVLAGAEYEVQLMSAFSQVGGERRHTLGSGTQG